MSNNKNTDCKSKLNSLNTPKERAHFVDVHVGQRLRKLRKLNGETQTEMADALGVTFQQVQKYERGSNRLSAGAMFLISHRYNVTPNWLYEGLIIQEDDNANDLLSQTITLLEFARPKTLKAINTLLAI